MDNQNTTLLENLRMVDIIGREPEIRRLDEIYNSNHAELLVIYGRRRIGKTFLINEYFRNKGVYFLLTGTQGAGVKEQLVNFSFQLADTFFRGARSETPASWQEAFHQLQSQINKIPKNKKCIIFLDELPWLSSKGSHFLSALEYFWNQYLSKRDNIILILCGSAAAWMIKNIINNKGGLYGRSTAEIHLQPFTLEQTQRFLNSRKIDLDKKQIIELYMAVGGVAKYLTYIKANQSSASNIQKLLFDDSSSLFREYNKLYASLFENFQDHMQVIEALATKRYGLTRNDLLKRTKLKSGGAFTKILYELIASNFIKFIPQYGKNKKDGKYRLVDEYSLFYNYWIKDAVTKQAHQISESYWLKKQNTQSFKAWAGYSFEGICLKHINKIIKALDLTVVAESVTTWSTSSAQIDLVLERSDHCINLFEIKFYNTEFVIDKEYADKLQQKRQEFILSTKTTKTVFMTLVTSYGVKKNQYYYNIINSEVIMDDLF